MEREQTIRETAILANLAALRLALAAALERATEAEAAMRAGKTNQAIGSALGIEQRTEEAGALYRAALALHRNRADFSKGGAP
jgi:hypothetical protein